MMITVTNDGIFPSSLQASVEVFSLTGGPRCQKSFQTLLETFSKFWIWNNLSLVPGEGDDHKMSQTIREYDSLLLSAFSLQFQDEKK